MRSIGDSLELVSAFRVEQTDPDSFYGLLAKDLIQYLEPFIDLRGKLVLDVGGGAGYFSAGFLAKGAIAIALEPDEKELSWRGTNFYAAVMGDGLKLPFISDCFDLTFSSNVLEHVRDPAGLLDEMIRVTKKGGLIFACYTNWLSPWGGHETSPWHYLGGSLARRIYEARYGKKPKNVFNESLFALSINKILKLLKNRNVNVLDLSPRYYPAWAKIVVKIPVLREFITWNLAILVKK